MSVFDAYGRYYDLLYRDKDYAAESRYVVQQLRRHAPGARRLLDLGCGTGAHAALLAAEGYDVAGVDLSDSMLEAAALRRASLPSDLRQRLRFERGDVRSIRLGTFDAVLALFHVASYQQTNADLAAMFATAAQQLPAGGLFLFDFWYGPAVLTQKPETRAKELQDEHVHVTRIAHSELRDAENLVTVEYRLLVEDKTTAKVHRINEVHVMRYLFLPEIDALLEGVGMRRVSASEWMTDAALGVRTWGGFVIARKSGL